MQELTNHIDQIQKMCMIHHVKSLFAFGSITGNNFRADSDIDLVVDIYDNDPLEYSDNYFELKF